MKFSTTSILLGAALGVSAHPGSHAHKYAHRSVEGRSEYVIAKKPVAVSSSVAAPAAPIPPAAFIPAPSESSATSSAVLSQPSNQGSGAGTFVEFCAGQSQAKRATAEEIAYKGNVGTPDSYGCNLMLVEQAIADKYQYTITFQNKGGKTQICNCWNKIGPDGDVNGFFFGNQALSFNLTVGATQVLAVDTNSQGACACCSIGSVSLTSIGEFACPWTEFDFGDSSNGGWNGADASCLVAAANDLEIAGLQVCGSGTCSTINPGGTGTNAYLGGMEAQDGVGLNIPPGKVSLTVAVDYQG